MQSQGKTGNAPYTGYECPWYAHYYIQNGYGASLQVYENAIFFIEKNSELIKWMYQNMMKTKQNKQKVYAIL